jgi:hypothetical protein
MIPFVPTALLIDKPLVKLKGFKQRDREATGEGRRLFDRGGFHALGRKEKIELAQWAQIDGHNTIVTSVPHLQHVFPGRSLGGYAPETPKQPDTHAARWSITSRNSG